MMLLTMMLLTMMLLTMMLLTMMMVAGGGQAGHDADPPRGCPVHQVRRQCWGFGLKSKLWPDVRAECQYNSATSTVQWPQC